MLELKTPTTAPWGAKVVRVDMPRRAEPGQVFVFEAVVENTGVLAWAPSFAQWPNREWPMIRLSYHLLRHDEMMIDRDGRRFLINRYVPPGARITLTDEFETPSEPGDYIIEWDMLSEAETWFAEVGGLTLRSFLRVAAPSSDPAPTQP